MHFLLLFLFLTPSLTQKIRGVNLGGWLVLEPWITPGLFSQFETTPRDQTAIDQLTFNMRLGPEEAKRQLEKHWSTWVTENDFIKIKELGLTHARLPFGWWIFGDSLSHYTNITYLDMALGWAQKHGIKVLLDLHAAPGSQNGYDNSGIACMTVQKGGCATDTQQKPLWFFSQDNLDLTITILKKVALRYKDHPAVWGLEFVNEPYASDNLDKLRGWYIQTYHEIRSIVKEWQLVMLMPWDPKSFVGFMSDKSVFYNVMFDVHIYEAWNFGMYSIPDELQIQKTYCTSGNDPVFLDKNVIPTFVGEWSLAIDDCAKSLNGFKTTANKNDQGHRCGIEQYSDDFYRGVAKAQLKLYEQASGWFFWNFKTEIEEHDWSYFKMAELGWVPNNANDIPDFIQETPCEQTPSRETLIYFNNDIDGDNVASVKKDNWSDCYDACYQQSGCNSFSYGWGACYLKSTTDRNLIKNNSGVVVGFLCNLKQGKDVAGNDIGNKQAANPQNCCGICASTKDCKAFSWNNYNGGTCWLKSGGTLVDNGATVAFVAGTQGNFLEVY